MTGKNRIPTGVVRCKKTLCVYNDFGLCENPRICKGNSDADCHKMTNQELIEKLDEWKNQ